MANLTINKWSPSRNAYEAYMSYEIDNAESDILLTFFNEWPVPRRQQLYEFLLEQPNGTTASYYSSIDLPDYLKARNWKPTQPTTQQQ